MSGFSVNITLTDEQLALLACRVAALLDDQRSEPVSEDAWLNVRNAARYLDCPESRIYDLVQLGHIEPERDGRRLLFRRSELDDYVRGRERRTRRRT